MTGETAIQIENLGKRYRLGSARSVGRAFGSALARRFRRAGGASDVDAHPGEADRDHSFWALRGIDLQVRRGEVLGVIGANGAGKSTLLKVLSRITDPSEGEVRLRGRVGSLLEVGTGFHPELSGRENIYLNGAILGMRKAEIAAQFDEIVDFSGVGRFLDTPVKRYSSGMRVRLAFAVAAHLQPEILIIDEVLAVGDAAFQKRCLGKMKDVSAEGRTVLFVSHNMSSVQQLCSRAICLDRGRIAHEGDPADVADHYLELVRDAASATTEDVSAVPRRAGLDERARLTTCRLIDERGCATDQLRFGEPFTIEIEAVGNERVEDVACVVGIDTHQQQRIATSTSEEADLRFTVHPGERVRARWRVEGLRLCPGRYALTVGLRRPKTPIDHLPAVRSFDVLPVMADEAVAPNGFWGVVHLPPKWDMETAMEADRGAGPTRDVAA